MFESIQKFSKFYFSIIIICKIIWIKYKLFKNIISKIYICLNIVWLCYVNYLTIFLINTGCCTICADNCFTWITLSEYEEWSNIVSSHYFSNRIFFNFKSIIFHCKFTIFVYFKLRFHFTDTKKIIYTHFTSYFS